MGHPAGIAAGVASLREAWQAALEGRCAQRLRQDASRAGGGAGEVWRVSHAAASAPKDAPRYLLSYYGDDFTGSTDVLEALSLGGVKTVLFLEPPSPERLAAFPQAAAFGIAGTSRAMTREQLDAHLPAVFAALGTLKASFCHYKVCSTFDSSPTLGSIGRALELGLQSFPQAFVPLVVGAPKLKRYVVFGHLFATADGVTHRLDRHPTMPQHPATPMSESDLRLHLAAQTDLATELVDVLTLESGMGFVRYFGLGRRRDLFRHGK